MIAWNIVNLGSGNVVYSTITKHSINNDGISERASLVSIIESQRDELKMRERAQSDANHIARQFAAAVLAFEERLVICTYFPSAKKILAFFRY